MSIRRLFPDAEDDIDTPLPGESFDQYGARRQAVQAQRAAQDQEDAAAQFQRDQAATAKAYQSQGVAHYNASDGSIKPITDPTTGSPMFGEGGNGGLVYTPAGEPKRVKFANLDSWQLADPYTPEGGAATKAVDGNTYLTSPGAPWKWTGVDPQAQAEQAEKERQQQLREQRQAATEAAAVSGHQVTQSRAKLIAHQKALEANTASLGDIQELAKFEDLDGDGIADKLEQHFSPDSNPVYSEKSGWFGGGDLTQSAQKLRDDLNSRKQQAQQLFQQRQTLRQQITGTQRLHDATQRRLELATAKRAQLIDQRLQADGLDFGDEASMAEAGIAPQAQNPAQGEQDWYAADDAQGYGEAAAGQIPAAVPAGGPRIYADAHKYQVTADEAGNEISRVEVPFGGQTNPQATAPAQGLSEQGQRMANAVAEFERRAAQQPLGPTQQANYEKAKAVLDREMAKAAPALPAEADMGGIPPAGAPVQAQPSKLYAVTQDGKLSFDPEQPTKGITQAWRDGALDQQSAKQAVEIARKAEEQRAELENLAGGAPQLKALLAGVGPGLGFLGGGSAAVAAGNLSGVNPALVAASGPFAPATALVLPAAEFVGGGLLAGKAAKRLQHKLAEYSTTLQTLEAAAQLHPGWEAAGELLPALPSAVGSIGNLAKIGGIAARDLGMGATTGAKAVAVGKAVSKVAGAGAAGGALAEGAIRPTVEAGLNLGADALGIEHEPTQAPTIGSIAQMATLGGLLAGHGIKFKGINEAQLGSVLARGEMRMRQNFSHDEPIPQEKLADIATAYPGLDANSLAELTKPLTNAERELFFKARGPAAEILRAGQTPVGTAEQATRGEQPIGVTSVDLRGKDDSGPRPSSSPPSPSNAPTVLGLNPPSPSGASPTPASPALSSRTSGETASRETTAPIGSTGIQSAPSNQPAAPPAAGQASDQQQRQDEPTITRADGKSTVSLGETSVTVPSEKEAGAIKMVQANERRARAKATPIDVEASEVAENKSANLPIRSDAAANDPQQQKADEIRQASAPGTTTEAPAGAKDSAGRPLAIGDPVQTISESGNANKWTVRGFTDKGHVLVERHDGLRTNISQESITSRPDRLLHAGEKPGEPSSAPTSPGEGQPGNSANLRSFSDSNDTIAELTRQRNNQQAMLDHGKLTPEEADQARAWVEHFDGRIASLQGGAAPGAGQPSAGKPGALPSGVATAPAPAGDSLSSESSVGQGRSSLPDSAQPVPGEGSAPQTAPEIKLPRDLAGAKPRYAYGQKQYELSFASDLDKTAYTLAQGTRNRRHADYLKTAQEQTGLSEQELVQHGQAVRAAIKAMARDGDPDAGPLTVPKQSVAAGSVSAKEGNVDASGTPDRQAPESGQVAPADKESAMPAPESAPLPAPSTFADASPIIRQSVREKAAELRAADQPIPALLARLIDGGRSANLGPAGQARYLADAAKADAEHGLGLAERGAHLAGSQSAGPAAKAESDAAPANTAKADIPAENTPAPQAAPEPAPAAPELMTPEQWLERSVEDYQYLAYSMRHARIAPYERRQRAAIETAFAEGRPVHVQAAAGYGIKPPRGYRRVGDQFEKATTFQNAVGEKINSRSTAFHPNSGTLGVPREQMPQVSSEHRGALANFLKGRGIDRENADVLPGSLKATQAEFNPGKVRKAEQTAAQGNMALNPRRILVSSDNHVIDGHHQWLERLKNRPNEPMPVLRLKATARDILSQIHEFPSAGMEKAPDIEEAAPKQSDLARRAAKDIERLSKVRNPSSFQEQMLRDAKKALAAETKAGSAPEPAPASPAAPLSDKAKRAQIFVAAMEEHLTAGRQLSEYQQGQLAKARQALIDEGRAGQPPAAPSAPAPVQPASESSQSAAPPPQPAPAKASLAVGDSIDVKGRPNEAYTVTRIEEKRVGATNPQGKAFTFPNHMVSKAGGAGAGKTAAPVDPPAAPAKASAPAPATGTSAIGKGSQVTYQGRPAVVKNMDEGKPFAFITMAADPARGLPEKNARVAIADLRPAEAAPEPVPASKPDSSTAAIPAATSERQPTTAAGKEAQRTLARLAGLQEKGVELDWRNRQARREAELDLARDLNAQVLGPNPKPTTGAGKQALANIGAWEPLRGQMNPGQLLSLHGEYARLEEDFTAQRLAIEAQVDANRPMLTALGVKEVRYGATKYGSGVEFGEDGALRIDAAKLAASMATVRENQAKLGIKGTPEDWFAQALAHEGIHAADVAVAKSKGQTIKQRYDALPDEALPEGWEKAGQEAYGAKNWDALPGWAKKAEFVRQVIEGKWTGRITEQLYKFIREAIDFLKKVAGFEKADPRFKAHVQEVESRIEALRAAERQPDAAKAPPAKPRPRGFRIPASPTGAPDVIDRILEQGGILSKGKMSKQPGFSAADYEGLTTLPGVYKRLLSGKLGPDQMAAQLDLDGPQALAEEIQRAIQTRKSAGTEAQRQATLEKQAQRFDKDALTAPKQPGEAKAINVSNLSVGDKVQIEGESLTVKAIDPDTFEVTLEDHKKYGIQKVDDGQAIYVESAQLQEHGADDFGPAEEAQGQAGSGEDFSLESVSAEQLRAEEKARAQKEAIAKGQSKPLAGSAGDLTADIFGEGETPLFNERRDNGSLGAAEPEGEASGRREQTPDPSRAASIKDLVTNALTPGTGERKRFVQYGAINPAQAARLKADTGLDLEGYRRNLDNSAVRHIWQQHGDPQTEIQRGNLPITREDFERLPELLERPDASLLVGKNRLGQEVILSAKRVNGYFIIAEEVRGNRILSLTTIYKKSAHPPANDATQGATPLFTPEALRSIAQRTLQQAASQRNFLRGNNPGASAKTPSSSFADAAPIIRQAAKEKARALRDAGQPVPGLLNRLIEGGRSADLAPEGQARYLADAAKADADQGLGLAERGVNLPGAAEGSGGGVLFATEPQPADRVAGPAFEEQLPERLRSALAAKAAEYPRALAISESAIARVGRHIKSDDPQLVASAIHQAERLDKDYKLGLDEWIARRGVKPKALPAARNYSPVEREANFRRWFANSKAVDSDGKPLVMVHHTPREFSEFLPGKIGSNMDGGFFGAGFYFAPEGEVSEGFRHYGELHKKGGGREVRAYLSLQNPLIVGREADGASRSALMARRDQIGAKALTAELRTKGHDGVMVYYQPNKLGEVVVFEPTQIKSADKNVGSYDPDHPSILAAAEPEPWRKEVRDEDAQKHFEDMIPPAQRAKATEEDQRFARFLAKERAANDARERWIERAAKAAKLTPAETEFAKDFDAEDPDTWNNAAQAVAPESALSDLAAYEDFDANDPDTWGEHNTREVQRHWSLYEATDGGKKLDADPMNWPDELLETEKAQALAEIIDNPGDSIAEWPLDKRQRKEAEKLAEEISEYDPKDADAATEQFLSEAELARIFHPSLV